MRTIYKYEIDDVPNLVQKVEMPEGSWICKAGVQDNGRQVVVWAMVDTDRPMVERTIIVTFTGFEMHPEMMLSGYVGTVTMCDGIVVHVFDVSRF